jgi:RNA polymerase sigma-70 factor (ECF subfamily)
MTDAELVALSRGGNLQAFNRLANRRNASLYRFVQRVLGDAEEARDICQDALLKAYLNIGRLRDPARFGAWLHHIALNLCRDRFRAGRNRFEQPYEEGNPGEAQLVAARGVQRAPDREAEQASLARLLNRALGELSGEQRTAIILREYQGFTCEEIAEITGVPPTTVRTRIFYGFRALRKILRRCGLTDADLRGGNSLP